MEFLGNQIQQAFLESYTEFGQNLFDSYINYADHWVQALDYKDADTGNMFDREALNNELENSRSTPGEALGSGE